MQFTSNAPTTANTFPQFLTINQTAAKFKDKGITETVLRTWYKQGKLPHIKVGNKGTRVLVNVDKLLTMLDEC